MAGNTVGGQLAAQTNKERHGSDFYKRIGALGGKAQVPKGFSLDRERAREAGRKGGLISRKTKAQ